MKTCFVTKQVFEQRKRNLQFRGGVGAELHLAARSALSQIANSEAEVDRVSRSWMI